MEYTTLHTPQMIIVRERIFAVIKEGALEMLLNAKLNDTDKKMLLAEAVHMYKWVRNSISTKCSTTSPLKTFHGEKPKIIGSF